MVIIRTKMDNVSVRFTLGREQYLFVSGKGVELDDSVFERIKDQVELFKDYVEVVEKEEAVEGEVKEEGEKKGKGKKQDDR